MTRTVDVARSLSEAARDASSLVAFRSAALGLLAGLVPFDRALFHELSPRAPLDNAALVRLDRGLLERSAETWDETAVALGRLRDVALARGDVASDLDAFPLSSKARGAWRSRVEKPFGVTHLAITHLRFAQRIISAVLLFRNSPNEFSSEELDTLRALAPVLAVGDAAWQGHGGGRYRGLPTELSCRDQRLTPRQRDLVVRVALGHTNRQIAQALGLSENTVRNALVGVRARLGASNRADIVRLAVLV